MNGELLPALPEPAAVMEAGTYPPEGHPVLAYLGRLGTPVSRESMLRRLNITARLLSHDTLEAMHFPWHHLTYVQLLAVRAKLMQHSAPQTVNVTLAAIRGVLKECWRMRYLTAEELQRACDVSRVKGERLPVGRALDTAELAQLLSSCQHDRRVPLGARDAALIGLLFGLDLGSYDPMAGTVRVLGKGNKQRELPVPGPAFWGRFFRQRHDTVPPDQA